MKRLIKEPILLVAITIISIVFFNQQHPREEEKKISRSGAYEALHFFNDQRAFPSEDLPASTYFVEFQKQKNRIEKSSFDNFWQSLGPNNVGGRTLAIAIDPIDTNIIWAGSASGGLWKSTTGGLGTNAWTRIEIGFPVLAVSSISIDPFNPNTILIGTGEVYNYKNSHMGISIRSTRGTYGMGAFKSTDGGITWNKSIDWTYQLNRGVWDFAFDPLDSAVVYCATTEGILKSTNSGDSWSFIFTEKMVIDLAINHLESNIIYAGVGNLGSANPGVYRSTNSGVNWTKLSTGIPTNQTGRTTVTCYKKNPKIVMASIGNDFSTKGLFRSTNDGESWTEMSGSSLDYLSYQGFYAEGVLMKDNDSSQVVVSGVNFFKSTTSGTNLTQKDVGGSSGSLHVDHHDIVSNPKNPNIIYIACDGGVYRSNNFGESFYSCNDGYVTSQFYAGFSNAVSDSTVAQGGLQDNGSWRYIGTSTWKKTTGGDGIFTAINPTDSKYQYTSSQYLQVFRSTNYGTNFTSVLGSFSSSLVNFVSPFVIAPSSPNILYAGKKNLMKSTDFGATWFDVGSNLDGNKIVAIAVSQTSADTIYASTVPTAIRAGVFRSANGGSSWVNVTGSLPNRYPMDIALNPNNSKEVYVVFSGFETSHIFRSTNAGLTWMDIHQNLPDVPFQSVAVDPFNENILYAGCDLGVFVSTDKGSSWTSMSNNLPSTVIVTDITFSVKNKKVRVSTHGNGVYQTDMLSKTISNTDQKKMLPDNLVLHQNYPNPFNPSTKIKFTIPALTPSLSRGERVILKVFDILGREITTLVNAELSPGEYEVEFNINDELSTITNELSANIYFYRLSAGNFSATKKFILLK